MRRVALTIAGSDSSGGAGLQADLATYAALGVHGTTAVTAVTAQNTRGVRRIHMVPALDLRAQLEAVLDDLPVHVVKTGMLGTMANVEAVAAALRARPLPLVVDPVLVATSGDTLGDDAVRGSLVRELIPLATLVTPNLDEAAALTGAPVATIDQMAASARALLGLGALAALVTGGHLADRAVDVLAVGDRCWELETERFAGHPVHGTGCGLSAAIAACLARGEPLETAVRSAKAHVAARIRDAEALGGGARLLGPAGGTVVTVEMRERS